tara:strand:- start:78 stop:572 length:495 start_codon:yes stop_codon:yes gene_type:complete
MKISIIAAIGKNKEIGLNNDLLWSISEDLQNFKKITMGHYLVMGRRTFQSIGKELKGRKLIILTSDPYLSVGEHLTAHSVEEAIYLAEKNAEEELMICGGAKVYKDFLGKADTMYLSRVDWTGDADTYFPDYDESIWTLKKEDFYPAKDDLTPSWSFQLLKKNA